MQVLFLLMMTVFLMQKAECQSSSNKNRFILQPSLVYHNCQGQEISRNVQGSDLFVGKPSVPSTTTLRLKGWFMLRSIDGLDRTILSIHSKTHINNIILDLQYNAILTTVTLFVEGIQLLYDSTNLQLNKWFFISIQLTDQKMIHLEVYFTTTQRILYQQITPQAGVNIGIENIIFNLGSPLADQTINSSCAYSKEIVLYQNYPFERSMMSNIQKNLSSQETYLFYYFDFYSISLTPGYLQSIGVKKDIIKFSNTNQNIKLFWQDAFSLPPINVSESGSILLSFDILLNSFPTNGQCKVLQLEFTFLNSLPPVTETIEFINIDTYQFNTNPKTTTHKFTDKWTTINFLINNRLHLHYYVWVGVDKSAQSEHTFANEVAYLHFNFADLLNKCELSFDNIRVYQGSYIEETPQCFNQVGEDNKQECLRCQDNFLLDKTDYKMTCDNKGTPSEINHISHINRDQCPINMVFLNQQCQCIKGFYLENGQCLKCPNYCLECTSPTSCNNNLKYQRDSNGKCTDNAFDDGFSCVQPTPLFDFTETRIIPQDHDCTVQNYSNYNFQNSILKLKQSDTFFYSFTISFQSTSSQNSPFSVFYNDVTEVIALFYDKQISPSVYTQINVFVNKVKKFNLEINFSGVTWIGVWTNFQDYVFLIHFNGQTIFRACTEIISFSKFNPSLCVGYCITNYGPGQVCKSLLPLPLLLVKGMPNPSTLGIERVFEYHSLDKFVIAQYQIKKQQNYDQIIFWDKSNEQHIIAFSSPFPIYKYQKGLGLYLQTQGTISEFPKSYGLLTFQCLIYIDQLENMAQFLQYTSDKYTVRHYLLTDLYNRFAQIRICMNEICRDTHYVKIQIQVQTPLLIVSKNKAPYDTNMNHFEFEIVSSVQRETITIVTSSYLPLGKIQNIYLANKFNREPFLIYLDDIKFYEYGGFVDFDYRENSGCFIYMNINPKVCIKLQEGYYSYENKIVSYQECQNLNESSVYFYIANPITQQCTMTDIKIERCKEIDFNGSSYFCKKCKEPNTILQADPFQSFLCNVCKDGYFFSEASLKCLPCHNKCSKCIKLFDNCTECAHDGQLPPTCQCFELNYYLETDYSCRKCEDKCKSCEQLSTYCIHCQENRIYPPDCECKRGYLEDKITLECYEIECDKKCLTCYDKASQCDECAQNRIEPPLCKCGQNYFEDTDGNCQSCGESQYYDTSIKGCLPCKSVCHECSGASDKCTSCKDGFVLQDSQCFCQSDRIPFANKKGDTKCLEKMLLDMEVRLNKSIYSLVFIFEEELQEIDFSSYSLNDILSIYLSQIPESTFEITNPRINGRELILDLILLKSISTQQGSAFFRQNNIFISRSEEYALSDRYKLLPISFNIGPFLFTEDVLINKQLDSIQDSLKNGNQDLLDFVQKFQAVFYLLNTLQPTIIFFLMKLNFPPNLYKFYQIIGKFIFSDIPDYQSHQTQQVYSVFKYSFESKQVMPAKQFSQYGFSDCLLVNIPLITIKYGIILLGMIIGIIIVDILGVQKLFGAGQKLKIFLFQRLNSENEVNLTIICISLMVQLISINQESVMNRLGFYLSLLFIMVMIIQFIFNVKQVNTKKDSQYAIVFTEKLLSRKNGLERNYFVFQLIKKYVVIVAIFILLPYPLFTCVFNGAVFLLSSISTMALNPYKSKLARIIKALGDFIISFIWFFYIKIAQLNVKLYENNIIDDDLIAEFQTCGNVIIITLLVYNYIYLIEFLLRIIQQIKDFRSAKKENIPLQKQQKLLQPIYKQQQSHLQSEYYSRISQSHKKLLKPKSILKKNQQSRFKVQK